jgi:hypothetical protein
MYDLSVCLAAIRKDNWPRLYNSIVGSVGDYSFELIFCGPHAELPDELKDLENVSCIQDFGAPTRAQQLSMKNASGLLMMAGFYHMDYQSVLDSWMKFRQRKSVLLRNILKGEVMVSEIQKQECIL